MQVQDATTKTRRGSRRLWMAVAVLIAVGVVAGTGALIVRAQLDPGDPVVGVSDVTVRDDEFAPAAIRVPAGTTVTWRWEGEEKHNVVGDGFESPTQEEGAFVHTFAEPGTYDYRCTRHFFMRGEVVVTG
jgi:plastocyanin